MTDDASANGNTDIGCKKVAEDASGDFEIDDITEIDGAKETEKPVVFTCRSEGVTVTAETKPENGIPESAVLHADKLVEGSEEYSDAMEKAREGLGLKKNEPLYYEPYDIYFTDGEEKIEPKTGDVKIRMKFNSNPFEKEDLSNNEIKTIEVTKEKEKNIVSKKIVIHTFENGEAERIDPEILSETSLEFKVSQFSVMGPGIMPIFTLKEHFTIKHALNTEEGISQDEKCSVSVVLLEPLSDPINPSHPSNGYPMKQEYTGTAKVTSIGTTPYIGSSITFDYGTAFFSLSPGQAIRIDTPEDLVPFTIGIFVSATSSLGSGYETEISGPYDYSLAGGPKYYTSDVTISHKIATPSISPTITPTPGPTTPAPGPTVTPIPTGSLKISKVVEGTTEDDDLRKEWTFKITLGNTHYNGFHAVESKGDVPIYSTSPIHFTNGVGTIKLMHGQTAQINGLPLGTYSILENEANQDGFTMSCTGSSGEIKENQTSEAIFTNSKPTGSLKISKKVTGSDADQNKLFNFKIALTGSAEATSFNDSCSVTSEGTENYSNTTISFSNGNATAQLKHNQTIKIKGLPINSNYSVTEVEANQDGYETTQTGDTGSLTSDSTPEAVFTNHKEDSGNLKLTKKVTGTGGDQNKDWKFTIKLTGAKASSFTQACKVTSTGTPTYSGTTINFTNGMANVKLKGGQSITIQGLPADHQYTVTETEADQDWYKTTKTGDTGTIPKNDTAEVIFTNNKDVGDLKISKTVTGTSGDLNKEWTFDIALTGDNVADFDKTCEVQSAGTVQYTDGSVTFSSGKAKIRMKSGQEIIIKKIPAGFTYTVSEEEANTDGYTTSGTGLSGSISKDTPAKVEFVNNKQQTSTLPSTGGSGTKNLMILRILLLAVGATTAKIISSKK